MEKMVGRVSSLNDLAKNEGDDYIASLGVHGEQLVNSVLGKYYALTRKGKVFIHSTVVAGVAFPISTTTTPVFGVWNKADSGKLLVPLAWMGQYVSGTAVQTGVGLSLVSNTGSGLATAAPVSALTEVAPRNALLGSGLGARCPGFSTGTLTTAGAWFYALGFNTFTGAATVPVAISNITRHDFDGALLIPPGNFIHVVGNAASTALYGQTLIVAELPY